MMDKLKQARQVQQELKDPHNSDRFRAYARILAEIEAQQRQAVIDQREAAGIDPDDGRDAVDVDDRVAELCDLLAARTSSGPSLAQIWFESHLPDDFEADDPATLSTYAEMDQSEWEGQVARWADSVRHQHDGLDSHPDRALAGKHVESHWSVGLDRFEAVVVDWDRERAMQDLLAGPSETTEAAIRANTEELA